MIETNNVKMLHLKGVYQSLEGRSDFDEDFFLNTLKNFVVEGVIEISIISSTIKDNTVCFIIEFHIEEGIEEDYLFNLEHWPLGVSKLQIV